MFTSLTLLYGLTLFILIIYSSWYYNSLAKKNRYVNKKWFLAIFTFISITCFGFLLVNFYAPLKLKIYSNLDHHFIQHDGYLVKDSIELGNTDTNILNPAPFNRFIFSKNENKSYISSAYSEDPFYYNPGNGIYRVISKTYPVSGATLRFVADSLNCEVKSIGGTGYELSVGAIIVRVNKEIKRGSSAWNIFGDDNSFINSRSYSDEKLRSCLKNIYILNSQIPAGAGEPVYYLSARFFSAASSIKYNNALVSPAENRFKAAIENNSSVAWGIGFRENNKNQYRIKIDTGNALSIINKFPRGYPLTEEIKDWNQSTVNKFLVSSPGDLLKASSIITEGFFFDFNGTNKNSRFYPLLLSYQKSDGRLPIGISIRSLEKPGSKKLITGEKLVLPAISGRFSWLFSIQDTFFWRFNNAADTSGWIWQIMSVMLLFFLLVIFSAIVSPAVRIGFIWQILSCITLVLITTRVFLYWRYKSFPPFDAMDLPSQEQLGNVWNYWVILGSILLLSVIFGWRFLHYLFTNIRDRIPVLRKAGNQDVSKKIQKSGQKWSGYFLEKWRQLTTNKFPLVKVLLSWFAVLILGYLSTKYFSDYTRQICMLLVLTYFLFLYISYRHSPLVSSSSEAWWRIDTNSLLSILVTNPVKIILSLSLFVTLVFIDIGLGIIFFNFLLFHEIWLCFNYSIAGSSAGRNKNARIFLIAGMLYLFAFIVNLQFLPNILNLYLRLPQQYFAVPLAGFCLVIAIAVFALRIPGKWLKLSVRMLAVLVVVIPFLVPKKEILKKAESTKYRIDVLAMPVEEVIEQAYMEGNTSTPVIRAAQNQWFINTFVTEENNPNVNSFRFNMLAHAPQNRGAKYNAQATDLVSSRFLIAEHGKWSVLLYVLLLLIPVCLSAAFYKLYPDFTKPTNYNYPAITTGFSIMNYLFTSGLLVILAATGKYIFFGQDLPFGSILSKLSIIFPVILIILIVKLFSSIPLQYYSNKLKLVPGISVFIFLAITLLFIEPSFNRNKEFGMGNMMKELGTSIENNIQPLLTYYDTSVKTRRLTMQQKDGLLRDSLKSLLAHGELTENNRFLYKILSDYTHSSYSDHINQVNLLYLDNHSGTLSLSVNENYFRVQAPPHLQNYWTGNVYSDPAVFNISLWDPTDGSIKKRRLNVKGIDEKISTVMLDSVLRVSLIAESSYNAGPEIVLENTGSSVVNLKLGSTIIALNSGDTMHLKNPTQLSILNPGGSYDRSLVIEPDVFMKNCFVNGSRYYTYPLESKFIWARNFSETIAGAYTDKQSRKNSVYLSLDAGISNTIFDKIHDALQTDTAYQDGAEYGITVADSEGRILVMTDYIKGLKRPDPNDKAAFNQVLFDEENLVSQQYLRKQIGNLNLLRMNPGPGSTLKPIVFSAVASQLNVDWTKFGSSGFTGKQGFYGGEKVALYDFEVNHGTVSKVSEYLKVSDNYYHSNVLLLGSYPKQDAQNLLRTQFSRSKLLPGFQWPYLYYNGNTYWLNDYKNWPGYAEGKADFGSDSSFINIGLSNNFGIYNRPKKGYYELFSRSYDTLLFKGSFQNSAFVLPEYGLFDQQATGINKRIPYDVFAYGFRQHVKGSSQVLIPPVKMVEAFGKLVSQNKNYSLTLNPAEQLHNYLPFYTDNAAIPYNTYQSLMQEEVFAGMRDALLQGTAAALGRRLTNGKPYYYYAKTGTTGDDRSENKSRLFVIVISLNDISDPDTDLRTNKFYTIYFTSQNGPNKQYEALQEEIIKYIQGTPGFISYMQDVEKTKLTKSK